jgi:hypothetical protein
MYFDRAFVANGGLLSYGPSADPNARSKAIRELLSITAFLLFKIRPGSGCSLLTHL